MAEYLDLLNIDVEDIAGRRILDIGSGVHRRFSEEAEILDAYVISVDPIPAEAWLGHIGMQTDERAAISDPVRYRQQADLEIRQGRLVRAHAEELPFAGNTFDAIVALFSVPFYLPQGRYIEDSLATFSEILRVLRPGGEAHVYPVIEPGRYTSSYGVVPTVVRKYIESTGSTFETRPGEGGTTHGVRFNSLHIKKP